MGSEFRSMDLNKEEKDGYSKELKELADSLCYEWELDRGSIIIDPLKGNTNYDQVKNVLERTMSLILRSIDPENNIKVKNIEHIKQSYYGLLTCTKIPVLKEICADITLVVVFSVLLWELTLRHFGLIGPLVVFAIILWLFSRLFYSIHILCRSDEEYLKKRFGFKRDGKNLKTDAYNIAKNRENEMVTNVIFSLAFIVLAILPIFCNNPELVFINTFLNCIALLLVTFVFFIQYLRDIFIRNDSKTAQQKLITAILGLTFFIVYVFGLLGGKADVSRIIGYLLDLMVTYGVFLLSRAIINTRKYRVWVDTYWRKTS